MSADKKVKFNVAICLFKDILGFCHHFAEYYLGENGALKVFVLESRERERERGYEETKWQNME